MSDKRKNEDLDSALDEYLDENTEECIGDECIIKTDRSIVERINKKIITEDGRQLL